MNIAVRYQSRGNNTKAVAEVIANKVGVKAEPITVPITSPVDILFIGGGVYAYTIDRELKDYLTTLEAENIKSVANFSTGGVMGGTKKMIPILESSGIHTHAETLPLKLGVKNHGSIGGKGHITLTDKQVNLITEFVEKIIK